MRIFSVIRMKLSTMLFPAVTLDEVHGAAEFHKKNKKEVEETFVEDSADLERPNVAARRSNPRLFEKLDIAKGSQALQKHK